MKTLQQTTPRKPLQKTNNRWKWMAGAAASAAAATTAQAQTTITLGGFVNNAGVDTLSADLWEPGGVGVNQLVGQGYNIGTSAKIAGLGFLSKNAPNGGWTVLAAVAHYNKTYGTRRNQVTNFGLTVNKGGVHTLKSVSAKSVAQTLQCSVVCSMAGNSSVNGGAVTTGTLKLTGSAGAGASITEDSFTFTAVPEPSSIAMLALGATGLLALRARRKAA